jgi:hypothetical protein
MTGRLGPDRREFLLGGAPNQRRVHRLRVPGRRAAPEEERHQVRKGGIGRIVAESSGRRTKAHGGQGLSHQALGRASRPLICLGAVTVVTVPVGYRRLVGARIAVLRGRIGGGRPAHIG